MAENKTIRENFFDSLTKGAKWDVGVSINRTNPLPLDQYSVFKTEAELDTYIGGAFSYPGQIVALVGETETIIYYLAEKADHTGLEKIEVGSMPGVDNKSIEIKIDENGDEYLTLVGLTDAKVGSSLVKGADGKISWSATTQSDLDADLTGIKIGISGLNTTVYGSADGATNTDAGLVNKVAALENKFSSMGGVFNFAGSFTEDDFVNQLASSYDVGDVVLVDGVKEYVCIEKDGVKKWEPFGDAKGIEQLKSSVSTLQGDVTGLKTSVGVKAEEDKAATGLYLYVDTVATEKANAAQAAAETTAANALSPVATQVETNKTDINTIKGNITTLSTNLDLKASTEYVNNQIGLVNTELGKKADKTYVDEELGKKANKTYVDEELGKKADQTALTTTNTAVETNAKNIATNAGKITTLEGTVSSHNTRIGSLESTVSGHDSKINDLTANLGTINDGSDKATAFGKAAAANALATTANTAAGAAQAKADSAYNLADTANKAAAKAQGEVDALEEVVAGKVDQTAYNEKIASIEGTLTTHNTAIGTKAKQQYVDTKLAEKVNTIDYNAKVDELNGAIALKADKSYVDEELGKKADATATSTAIQKLEEKVGSLGNVMNFVGELNGSTDKDGVVTIIGIKNNPDNKTPENGDVGYYNDFEYVYIDGVWEKFGDTTLEGSRISTLENIVGKAASGTPGEEGYVEATGLVKAAEDLKAEDTTIKASITTLSTTVGTNHTAVTNRLTTLETNSATKDELTSAVNTINDTISDLDAAYQAADATEKSARETAINNLNTYITSALSWGSFDPSVTE